MVEFFSPSKVFKGFMNGKYSKHCFLAEIKILVSPTWKPHPPASFKAGRREKRTSGVADGPGDGARESTSLQQRNGRSALPLVRAHLLNTIPCCLSPSTSTPSCPGDTCHTGQMMLLVESPLLALSHSLGHSESPLPMDKARHFLAFSKPLKVPLHRHKSCTNTFLLFPTTGLGGGDPTTGVTHSYVLLVFFLPQPFSLAVSFSCPSPLKVGVLQTSALSLLLYPYSLPWKCLSLAQTSPKLQTNIFTLLCISF